MSRRRLMLGVGFGVLAGAADATTVVDAWSRPALKLRRPEQSVLLAAAMAGNRLVAVGERGVVVLSDDMGRSWRQAQSVPVSVSLTTVRFSDNQRGYAIGHAGTVLQTADGGETWKRLLDGAKLAAVVLKQARAVGEATALADAERLAAGQPDRPLLDLALVGATGLFAVGAYGVALRSSDLGASWESQGHRLPNPKGLHLYAIRSVGNGIVVVAGEQGSLFRSEDGGETYRRIALPYQGSFFTLELPSETEMLVAGLRGNVWRSTDAGVNWSQVKLPVAANITGSARRADGSMVMASQAGLVLAGRDDVFAPLALPALPPLNGVLPLPSGALLALSIQGPVLLPSLPTK